MRYRIVHRTVYDYAEPVTVSHHTARLEPRQLAAQRTEEFSLAMTPEPAVRKVRTDYFGNRVCFFSIQAIHRQLEVTATSLVNLGAGRVPELSFAPAWETVAAMFRDPVSPDLVDTYQFCFDSPLLAASAELADYARVSFPDDAPLLSGLRDLTRRIYEDFTYDPVATTVITPLAEVLRSRRGVCQDFAHLAIAALRSLGLPARYVSGYLRTRPPEGGQRLRGADASHAWFAAFCPGADWVEFDPTNNLMPSDEHINVAVGRDFSDVSPVSGVITGGGAHEVHVAVDVDEV
jgi:transglutaminase-like putative cysteine protease